MDQGFIIAGWLDYGVHRDAVLKHFTVCAAASRTEPGCLDYVVCADPEFAGRVIVFERWSTNEDLVEHFRTPHIADFRAAVAAYPRVGRDLRRHFVVRSEQFSSATVAPT